MEPSFAFTATYDLESASVAARTLFVQTWRVLLPFGLFTLAMGLAGIVFFGSFLGVWEVAWMLAFLVLMSVLSSAYSYWLTTQRVVRSLVGTAQFNLTEADLSISRPDEGSQVLPWKRFKFAKRDTKNLLLFLSNRAAIVIPASALSEAALKFVITRVPEKR